MKLVKVVSVFTLSCLLFTACSTSGSATSILNHKKSSLYGSEWKLVDDENSIVKGFNGENVSLKIDPNDFKVSGFAGCNQYHSEAAADGNSISFAPVGSTKMLCPEAKSEAAFLGVLDDVNRYEIKGNELYFYKGNMLLLKFVN
ncbi:MAG TPA: META domain-containing protein [Faecalibacter sp.]|uniref:META domain-containing protein n=1 Tax=Faecalibacter sp. LW9 TaxID=3103144 RepID=UPI002B0022D8|nr:META domain-containing protein [Faecalibacter sp. LW9]